MPEPSLAGHIIPSTKKYRHHACMNTDKRVQRTIPPMELSSEDDSVLAKPAKSKGL